MVASRSEIKTGELEPFALNFEIVPTGSTAYKLAKVAAGEAEAFVSRGPKSEWDVCAGVLLVEEAGGQGTDLKGREIIYNQAHTDIYGIVASNSALHRELIDRVAAMPPSQRLSGWTEHDER
jgi:myo-inositol-1(or 4)-monophosphatase